MAGESGKGEGVRSNNAECSKPNPLDGKGGSWLEEDDPCHLLVAASGLAGGGGFPFASMVTVLVM